PALGVARAAEERAARSLTERHRLAALLANVLGLDDRWNRVPRLVDVERLLAARVTRAGEERPALALPAPQGLAALGAAVLGLDGRRACLAVHRPGRLALGVLRAAEELTGAAELHHHRSATDLAGLGRRHLHALHPRRGRLERLLERVIE